MTLKPLLTIVAACAAFSVQAIEFRSADTHNADDYPTVAAVKYMSELLEKKSGGKHKIKVFNKQALGSEKETIDQVKIGALDFTRVNVGPMNAICPLTQVPTMPFLFSSIAHMRKSLDGPVGEEILKSCESAGFIGLAFYDSGARSIYAKKPIKTVADAKGLKIRVQQSDLWVALVSAMGANATPMPYGEVYTGLKTGLILVGLDEGQSTYGTSGRDRIEGRGGEVSTRQRAARLAESYLRLNDNGRHTEMTEGNGITGLRERLAAIGGSLTTQQTDGFSAAIQFPLQESA